MTSSPSTAVTTSHPVVLTSSSQPKVIGLPPSDDGSLILQDLGKEINHFGQAPKLVTLRDVRLQVEQGFIPLVSIDRDAAGKALTGIRPGSAVAIVPNAELNSMRAYYEGGVYTRPQNREPTYKEWLEYAGLAASRASERYPTVAVSMISSWDYLTQIGYVDVRPGRKFAVNLFDVNDDGTSSEPTERTVWRGGWQMGYCGDEEGRPVVIETDQGFRGGVEISPRGGDGPTRHGDEFRSKFEQAKADANKLTSEWHKDT